MVSRFFSRLRVWKTAAFVFAIVAFWVLSWCSWQKPEAPTNADLSWKTQDQIKPKDACTAAFADAIFALPEFVELKETYDNALANPEKDEDSLLWYYFSIYDSSEGIYDISLVENYAERVVPVERFEMLKETGELFLYDTVTDSFDSAITLPETYLQFYADNCKNISLADWVVYNDNQEDVDTRIFFAFGEEPFWSLYLEWEQVTFSNPDIEEAKYTVAVSKTDDGVVFQGEGVSWKFVKQTCFDTSIGERHVYTASVNIFDTPLQWCADAMQQYADGDDFFWYERSWSMEELIEETNLPIENDAVGYMVQGINGPYVLIGISYEDWGYSIVMEKTAQGWEKVWAWQDVDYGSCKEVQERDPDLWSWSVFLECSEDMPRG